MINYYHINEFIKDTTICRSGKIGIISLGERIVYRHESNKGSIIEYKDFDGRHKIILILDAMYRNRKVNFSFSGAIDYIPSLYNINNNSFLNGRAKNNTSVVITDDIINSLWNNTLDSVSLTERSDQLSDTMAVKWCREISVDGIKCDCPNINTLIRIFCEAHLLDYLDPTNCRYHYDTSLVNWFQADFYESVILSSTPYNEWNMLGITHYGQMGMYSKNKLYGVIPVVDLSNDF